MQKFDPWSSKQLDSEALFKEFGVSQLKDSWKKLLNHYLLERNIVVGQRDFEKIANCIKKGQPFINITGLAPSGNMHLGHKAVIDLFLVFKNLGARNYFCIADIEAYASRENIETMDQARKIAANNIAHLLALGLDEEDIYLQSCYEPRYYELAFEISKKITKRAFEATYGHVDLGKMGSALLQYADILHPQLEDFEGKMPSITPIGIDQDPHARIARDVAKRLPYNMEVPSFIHIMHQSGLLQGTKMSSSMPDSAIFLNDSPEVVKAKISNAFTGGRETAEMQRKLGGKPEICKVCEILKFHYPNTQELQEIVFSCKKGARLCGETKKLTIEFLNGFLKEHQKKVKEKEPIATKIVFGKRKKQKQ
ncbi:MAG: tryptophan--tRNA ligase [Candidatus Diapherotrites archaeon]|nr:tryptophan--tRNA ligase [Candidatus Diapherotrites archaeon]